MCIIIFGQINNIVIVIVQRPIQAVDSVANWTQQGAYNVHPV